MMFEFLWTDWCFLITLSVVIVLIIRSYRKEPTRRAMQQIFKQPIAAGSAVVLLLFLIIGILDCIHFKTTEEIQARSVLDRILAPLDEVVEKTYSAPLALRLYTSEVIWTDGQARQVYSKLNYTENFKNKTDVQHWLKYVIPMAFGFSALITFAVILIWRVFKLQITASIISMLVTFFICLFCIITLYWISRELHVFGTGRIGQDIFYYSVKSIRTGLVIGILTTLLMMPLAIILGIAAGYFGGIIDDIIQYIYTTLSSIPGVLLISAAVLSMQTFIANHASQFPSLQQAADARLLILCLILGVTSWTSLCRLLRAEALKLREIEFVRAAQVLGSSSVKIIAKHLLPNVMHLVIITLVLDFSFLVLAEAVLSYVGVGVSPLTMSWGNMINASRLELARDPIVWWPVVAAFCFMFTLVLASNIFADAVRDAFDPKRANI